MATTRLSDVIDTQVYQDIPQEVSPEKTAFFESGIAVRTPQLDEYVNAPGELVTLPYWKGLDNNADPSNASDDPAIKASTLKIEQGSQVARKFMISQGWSSADLASQIAMGDHAMTAIKRMTGTYWTHQWQQYILSAAKGILAANVASNGGDMVIDIAGATNADVSSTSVFRRENFVSSVFTLGDSFDDISTIAVHNIIYQRMVNNDDIQFIEDSKGKLSIPTYLGRRVVIDDSMPYTPGAGTGAADAAPKYVSVLFGNGMFGYGEGDPDIPVAVTRDEEAANGAGIEILRERKNWIIHPKGHSIKGTPADGHFFTKSELEVAARWERTAANRKSVPISFLITNG